MKRIIAGIVLIALIIAAVAAPYVIGMRVENLFRQHVARLAAQINRPIQIVQYQRGWLNAEAVTRVKLPDTRITLHHHITHGPYAVFGWAKIRTTPDLEDNPAVNYYFGDKPALTIKTRFGFDGTVHMQARSPEFKKPGRKHPDTTVTWGGVQATVRSDGSRIHYTATFPLLGIQTPKVDMTVHGISLQGSGRAMPVTASGQTPINWQSKSLARVEKFALHNQREEAKIQASLKWHLETGLDKAGHYGATSRLQITNAMFKQAGGRQSTPLKIDKAVLHMALNGINTKALARLVRDVRTLSRQSATAGQPTPDKLFKRLMQHLPELLTQSTEFLVEIPVYKSNSGELGLHGRATLGPPRPGLDHLPPVFKLLRRIEVNLQAFASRKLLHRILGQRAAVLKTLVKRQWLQLENDRYTLRAHYGPQRVSINGQPAMKLLQLLR